MKKIIGYILGSCVLMILVVVMYLMADQSATLANWRMNKCYEVLSSYSQANLFESNIYEITDEQCHENVSGWHPGDMGDGPQKISYKTGRRVFYASNGDRYFTVVKDSNYIYIDGLSKSITLYSPVDTAIKKTEFMSKNEKVAFAKLQSQLTEAVSRYEILADGLIVRDKLTNLEWMTCFVGSSHKDGKCIATDTDSKGYRWEEEGISVYDWQSAKDIAANFSYAGYDDWTMPTIEQLKTLIFCTSGEPDLFPRKQCDGVFESPTLVSEVFANSARGYWSISPTQHSWSDGMQSLNTHTSESETNDKAEELNVLLVRSVAIKKNKYDKNKVTISKTKVLNESNEIDPEASKKTDMSQDMSTCTKGDCKNGEGKILFADGKQYTGGFKDGVYDGYGYLGIGDGAFYLGDFKAGLFHGDGGFFQEDGTFYIGEFKKGMHHGHGTLTSSKGYTYVGEFKDDQFHGQGVYTDKNGREYSGKFIKGEFTN